MTHPWWLPPDWQSLLFCYLASIAATQVWKGWFKARYGEKPLNWRIRAVSIGLTFLILLVDALLQGMYSLDAVRVALVYGLPTPFAYLILQRVARAKFPNLAAGLGEQRRQEMPPGREPWTEDERRHYRQKARDMFGDTITRERGDL